MLPKSKTNQQYIEVIYVFLFEAKKWPVYILIEDEYGMTNLDGRESTIFRARA